METVTRYNDAGEVISAHKCEFKLEVKNGVRVFTFCNMEFTEGALKGFKMQPGAPIVFLTFERGYLGPFVGLHRRTRVRNHSFSLGND